MNLQLLEDIVDQVKYEPWPVEKKIDFVLVYEPVVSYMVEEAGEGLILSYST